MEKKTFNDMMANLPTTETDMTRVMVEMEDGRKGWISANGLAQVMAGLMEINYLKYKYFRNQTNIQYVEVLRLNESSSNNVKIEIEQDMGDIFLCYIHVYRHVGSNQKLRCQKHDIIGQFDLYVDETNSILYIKVPTYSLIMVTSSKKELANTITIDKGNTITDVSDLVKV